MLGENPKKERFYFFESPYSYNGKYREIIKSSSQYAIPMASTGCQHSMFKVSGWSLPKRGRIMSFSTGTHYWKFVFGVRGRRTC